MVKESAVKKLYDAAAEGNATTIQSLLENDPFLLNKASFANTKETLLHVAAAIGHVDVASMLLEKAPSTCWSRDDNGMNPIHVAAMSGREEVLKLLVEKDAFAAMERLDRGETVLHLCVKHRRLEALRVLVSKLGGFVCAEDDAGETVLHLAVRYRQVEMIRYLTTNTKIDKKSKNSKGETPAKILKQHISYSGSDHETDEIKQLLRSPSAHSSQIPPADWLTKKRDSIMVVAVLIATMAFQAAVSPTGGVWQDDTTAHKAGEAVMAYKDPRIYRNFMRSNTVAFVTSLSIILLLIIGLPFKYRFFMWALVLIMWVSVTAVGVTYGASIMVATPVAHKDSLSSVIQIAIVVWVGLMSFLLVVNTFRHLYQKLRDSGLEFPSWGRRSKAESVTV
ncbi:ankyrin repeat-containing protein-like protein [Salvia divinorum]|uniref:Ankyrin repeat-containing protein-like protein n=1 Tax=Salvia divinorum TaxID=28513 RepID=A0ABD1H9B6_SALDI